MIMLIGTKQHLNNILKFMKKLSSTEADLKESVACKKKRVKTFLDKAEQNRNFIQICSHYTEEITA